MSCVVKSHSDFQKCFEFCESQIRENKALVLESSGPAVSRCIAIAEKLKRSHPEFSVVSSLGEDNGEPSVSFEFKCLL